MHQSIWLSLIHPFAKKVLVNLFDIACIISQHPSCQFIALSPMFDTAKIHFVDFLDYTITMLFIAEIAVKCMLRAVKCMF